MNAPELEGEQRTALDAVLSVARQEGECFCLQGLAGTGKTTVLAAAADRLKSQQPFIVAPTGKAASVLRRKTGIVATTLHRMLYMPVVDDEGDLTFVLKRPPDGLRGKVALVDEASMIGEQLAADLIGTGVTVIASGDPGQLPPVHAAPFFDQADFTLREIRRQAAGSPIIRQAHRVRSGHAYENDGDGFQVVDRRQAFNLLDWADVVLCWRNRTRHRVNGVIRSLRGIDPNAAPVAGEPLMCLENSPLGMMNGEVFKVRDYSRTGWIQLEDGPDGWIKKPWLEWRALSDEKQPRRRASFALGYASTVHKAQGSEWSNVLILDEFSGSDRDRWLYTAITRASQAVRIVRLGRTQ
jgi:exodeoxyribonuclease V